MLSCNPPDSNDAIKKIEEAKPLLQNGDIIVRNGLDEVSRTTRNFNRKDKTYSHCGILQIEKDTVFVYHALGGVYNRSQALLREPIDSFCAPAKTDKFAVYRYRLSAAQGLQLSELVASYYKNKLPFDLFFNFYTDDRMYCSEFVFKCLNKVLDNKLLQYLNDQEPLYVSVDDLYLNDMAKPVIEQQF